MNKLIATAVTSVVAALSFAGAAVAQDVAPAKTRAEVIAELQAARDSGELARMQEEKGIASYVTPAKKDTALAAKQAPKKAVEKVAEKNG